MLPGFLRGLVIDDDTKAVRLDPTDYNARRDLARSAVAEYGRLLKEQAREYTEEEINTYLEDNDGFIDDNAISIIASAVADDLTPISYYDAFIAWVGIDGYDRLDEYDIREKNNVYSALNAYFYDYSRDHAYDYSADTMGSSDEFRIDSI
jgi:hypothetical protein